MAMYFENEPAYERLVLIAYANSEHSDEPAHSHRLASAFTARMQLLYETNWDFDILFVLSMHKNNNCLIISWPILIIIAVHCMV